ncbi:MAG TPA: hypothetical protein DD640_00450 [Clostridiales bacterium]|nr:hypothetical protein [Clostridiales bacterium]
MTKRVTIKDIASQVGVSVTTVAKAINNQARISEDTRQAVLNAAQQMGYKPNRTARAMASNEMNLAVIYPALPREFILYLEEGFHRAAEELADFRVNIKLLSYTNLNAADQVDDYLRQLVEPTQRIQGFILFASRHEDLYQNRLHQIAKQGIPFIYIVSEGNSPDALGTIRLNSEITGAMAAQFLQMTIPVSRPVMILVGTKELKVHSRCVDGFMRQAKKMNLRVGGVFETNDDKDVAYYLTDNLNRDWPDMAGIYVASYNSVGVCQWYEDHGRKGEVKIIGHDLYPALAEKLEAGSLSATLFQDQYEYGRKSLHYLFEYLTGSRKKEDCTKLMTPQLVMQSNLSSYRNSY